MHLQHPFYKFPFHFDAERMRAEVEALPEEAWQWHPTGFKGNSATLLITTNGTMNHDTDAPMRPTEYLLRSPYIMQVLAKFRTLHGRARLMRLDPGCGVPPHVDVNYYWRKRTRVHIPITTDPEIRFNCGNDSVHMAAGEAWTFDNWIVHEVVNETPTCRVHLAFDTFGSSDFWAMARPLGEQIEPEFVPFEPGVQTQLAYESFIDAPVMSPSELELELNRLANDAAVHPKNDPAAVARFRAFAGNLCNEWRMIWYAKGPTPEGIEVFKGFLEQVRQAIKSLPDDLSLASNDKRLIRGVTPIIAVMIRDGSNSEHEGVTPVAAEGTTATQAMPLNTLKRTAPKAPRFERPVFVVAAPRSGSTMLFEMLSGNRGFWTLGDEGHGQLESIPSLAPRNRGFDSNRLTAEDLTAEIRTQLHANYVEGLRDAGSRRYITLGEAAPETLRFLEKTPKNALRIPFLKAAYPDAKFIFLHRDAKSNISSIMEAWRSSNFVTYRNLPDWKGLPWSLLLLPGWREMIGADLADIALRQWSDTNAIMLDDLETLPPEDWIAIRYEDLTAYRRGALKQLCKFADVEFGEEMRRLVQQPPKLSRYTVTPPSADKWRKNADAILPLLPRTEAVAERLAKLEPLGV